MEPSLAGRRDSRGHARWAISRLVSEPPASSYGNRPPAEIVALAASLRELTETMLRVPRLDAALAAEVERTRAALDALERALAPHALGDALPRLGPEPATQRPYYLSGVLLGPHHPLQPELRIAHEDGVTHGSVRFGVTFEGPPGCVHGGFVAHFFDQILGQHNLWAKIPAMTGTLSVRFRRGTPILRELAFDVRHERRGERKVITTGRLVADGEVCSEAEGTFVVPKQGWAER
jgi:acyl-coenzyme A thioesterase PaaI-like protein